MAAAYSRVLMMRKISPPSPCFLKLPAGITARKPLYIKRGPKGGECVRRNSIEWEKLQIFRARLSTETAKLELARGLAALTTVGLVFLSVRYLAPEAISESFPEDTSKKPSSPKPDESP